MSIIRQILSQKIPLWRSEINELIKNHGDKVISEVTVKQLYGGARGVRTLVCDTSNVPAETGLIIRGRKLEDVKNVSPEEIFFLLLTGELPSPEELTELKNDLMVRKQVPAYVWDVIKSLPQDMHPMTIFLTAIASMQRESMFVQEYSQGIKKENYWKPMLEDSLNLVAKLPSIAAAIYRIRYRKGDIRYPKPNNDFSKDFVQMMGMDSLEFYELMKLYFTIHSDHEGGNVSSLTTSTVNSALSDIYYSVAAGMAGLAGPLHGLANQETLKWILDTLKNFNGIPTKEQIKDFAWQTLEQGKVIPGYGHAVLRVTDPRFTAFLEFGRKHCMSDPIFVTVSHIYDVVPGILQKMQKIKDPWPNVDAISGSLLYHYGLTEFSFYTVLFGVSRILGLASQAVISRALELPILRPKSVTTEWVRDYVVKN